MRTLLVTGAAGFIGSNFVRLLLTRGEPVKLVAFDKLTYAGNLANLQDLLEAHPKKLAFVKGDICDPAAVERTFDEHGVTEVVNFAAESHVDRSILGSGPFVQANVVGTQVLLDVSKAKGIQKYLQVSTDEVYGTLPEDKPEEKFTEETPLAPNSPYSATKAAGDCLVRSYFHTFKMPVLTTHCSNNYGPYQFPEKAIPLFVTNLMEGKKIPLYGDGLNVRDWLYVEDHCEAILAVLERGRAGEVYNVGGHNEYPNLEIVRRVLAELGKPESLIHYVKDRPGHDRRYAIDASKIERELGWRPRHTFESALPLTVRWYLAQPEWLQRVRNGAYRDYYARQYGS